MNGGERLYEPMIVGRYNLSTKNSESIALDNANMRGVRAVVSSCAAYKRKGPLRSGNFLSAAQE